MWRDIFFLLGVARTQSQGRQGTDSKRGETAVCAPVSKGGGGNRKKGLMGLTFPSLAKESTAKEKSGRPTDPSPLHYTLKDFLFRAAKMSPGTQIWGAEDLNPRKQTIRLALFLENATLPSFRIVY